MSALLKAAESCRTPGGDNGVEFLRHLANVISMKSSSSVRVISCPDCDLMVDRRKFLKTAATGIAASVAAPRLGGPAPGDSAPAATASPSSETLVTTLYRSLNEEQRKTVVFPFDNPLRLKVD